MTQNSKISFIRFDYFINYKSIFECYNDYVKNIFQEE